MEAKENLEKTKSVPTIYSSHACNCSSEAEEPQVPAQPEPPSKTLYQKFKKELMM